MAKRKTPLFDMALGASFKSPIRGHKHCEPIEPTLEWFKDYEVRSGSDGKPGIYIRKYNVRLATFNAGTVALQTRLKLLFERAHNSEVIRAVKTRKRKPRAYSYFANSDVGEQKGWK